MHNIIPIPPFSFWNLFQITSSQPTNTKTSNLCCLVNWYVIWCKVWFKVLSLSKNWSKGVVCGMKQGHCSIWYGARFKGSGILRNSNVIVETIKKTLGPINEDGANFPCNFGKWIEKIIQDRLKTNDIFKRISVARSMMRQGTSHHY